MTPEEALQFAISEAIGRSYDETEQALRKALAIVTRAAGGPCVQCAEALGPRAAASAARCCACSFEGYAAGRRRALNDLKTWLEKGGPFLMDGVRETTQDLIDDIVAHLDQTLENIR